MPLPLALNDPTCICTLCSLGSQQKVDRRPEGSGASGNKRERCFGVEAYWRQLDPADRRKLLRAPLAKMAEGGLCCRAVGG